MRNFLMILTFLVSLTAYSQESPKPVTVDGQKGFFLSRPHMEYFYKTLQINELLETRKSECDTLVQSLERKNIELHKRCSTSDSIITKQDQIVKKQGEIISTKEEQIKNFESVEVLQGKKIKELIDENVGLNKKLEKERPKKFWWGGTGFAAGVCLVLLFTL